MGHIGKLSRGMKWWKNNRDLDGVLKPHIAQDYDKMLDVDYYLEYIEGKDRDKVELALYQYFLLHHAEGGRKSKLFRDIKKKLDDGDFNSKKPKVEAKKADKEA